MPKIKTVERQIGNLEKFEVSIHYPSGRDVRSDRDGLPGYPYLNSAKHDFTVAQWREQRFAQVYPGFEIKVWLADGTEAHGATRLATVRDTYLDGDSQSG